MDGLDGWVASVVHSIRLTGPPLPASTYTTTHNHHGSLPSAEMQKLCLKTFFSCTQFALPFSAPGVDPQTRASFPLYIYVCIGPCMLSPTHSSTQNTTPKINTPQCCGGWSWWGTPSPRSCPRTRSPPRPMTASAGPGGRHVGVYVCVLYLCMCVVPPTHRSHPHQTEPDTHATHTNR